MQKWLWVLLALIVSSGIYFSIRYGLRPKPIPIMKPTYFGSLEEMGVVTYRRLRQQIRSEKIIILGTDFTSPENQDVWKGLIKAALDDKVRIQTVMYDEKNPPIEYFNKFTNLEFGALSDKDFKTILLNSRRRDGLLVILTTNHDSSHLYKGSLTKKLESSALGPIFSLSQTSLILNKEQLETLSQSCADLDPNDFLSRMDCIIFRFSRQHQRRKLDVEKLYGAVERYGLKEYLMFIHPPQVPSSEEAVESTH